MARSTIKIRGTLKEGQAKIRSLIAHPMETGRRTNKDTGNLIPAHFIQEVLCELNGTTVLTAQWGQSISKNPTLFFDLKKVKAGDTFKMSWTDNQGKKDSAEGVITPKGKKGKFRI
ncbi:MAG: thiosulfate oxidation carrier complex protein SoxZ [Methylococcales bacterium]|jgi:sulfur-oxidizing protein SoxZ|nr:thiosulfate oxidation carrier complex protein SoxZ [Methylococcales bacterium]MBT7444118.1 thiosulfate oxidation carrier complex protein SoxZ [Methylococcales bacterium]